MADDDDFREACRNGNMDEVNRLLEMPEIQVYVKLDASVLLQDAAQNGHLEVVNRLLETPGVQANMGLARPVLALRRAAEYNHPSIVDRLLDFDDVKKSLGYEPDTAKYEIMGKLAQDYNWTEQQMTKSAGKQGPSSARDKLADPDENPDSKPTPR